MVRISFAVLVIAAIGCTEPVVTPIPAAAPARATWWFPDALSPVANGPQRALQRFVEAHEGAPPSVQPAIEWDVPPGDLLVTLSRADGSLVDMVAKRTADGRGVRLVPTSALVAGARYTVSVEANDDVAAHTFTFSVTDTPTASLDPSADVGPYPSAFFVNADGKTRLPPLPIADLGALDVASIERAIAEVPGFSTSARVSFPLERGRADDVTGFSIVTLDGAPVDS